MKLLTFIIPAAAALLPQQNNYLEPIIPQQDKDDETVYQDATVEHSLLLRKFDDSERFLRFAAHSSHKSHSSHRSHSSGTTNKHYSHTSHTSGSYDSGTTSSSTTSNSTKSSTTTNKPAESTVVKKLTLSGSLPVENYTVDNYAILSCKSEGFSSGTVFYLYKYKDGKTLGSYTYASAVSASNMEMHNLNYNTTYKFQVRVEDSGKTYWSNVVMIKTGDDPFKYDSKSLPVSTNELNTIIEKTVKAIENTVDLPENAKVLVADFTSTEVKNSLGRETAVSVKRALNSLKKYELISASDELTRQMKVDSGTPDYLSAIQYGTSSSSEYVFYGEILEFNQEMFKIKIKVINVRERNILTEKEAFIPKK